MKNWKFRLEQIRQFARDNAAELMVACAVVGTVSGVIYQGYSVHKAGKYNDAMLELSRESLDHYKEHFRG